MRHERVDPVPALYQAKPDLDLRVEASFETVSLTLTRLRGTLEAICPSASTDHRLELVLAEACNNVVEHALAGQEGEAFRLALWIGPDRVLVRLTDRGRAMPGGRLPCGGAPAPSADTPPEGGFGWPLIRRLCSSIRYCRRDGENRLDLAIPIGSPAPE